jgi:hypothetical protein
MLLIQKHTENQLKIYRALKKNQNNLNELVCKAREDGEFFVLEMWEWEINIIIKKVLISSREAVFLVKLFTVA